MYVLGGKHAKALPLMQEGLETLRRAIGDGDPDSDPERLAAMYGLMLELGDAHGAVSNLGAALPLLQEALDGLRRVCGREHPDTLRALCAMGSLRNDMGNPSRRDTSSRCNC